jgi:hypothetical protein
MLTERNNERLVYHIFNARQVHLVPGFIAQFRDISARFGIPTRYVLCNYSPALYEKYKKLIDEIGADKFEFIEDSWSRMIYRMNRMLGNKNSKFIIHGIILKIWYLLPTIYTHHARRFSWVCWGAGIAEKGRLETVLKRRLYNSFGKINCLMSGDKHDLKTKFKVKDRTHLIPYVSNYNLQELEHIRPFFSQDKVNILVGHRATDYLNHLKLLQQLSSYAEEEIRIVCFLNYGSDDKEYIKQVIDLGESLFREKFVPITKLLSKEEYEGVMKSINISLIAGRKQAGLGAIYRTILYKGTVFLDNNGKNMEWLKYINVQAASIDDIPHYSFEEFISVVNAQQKEENQQRFLQFVNKERLLNEWKDFILQH